MSIEVYGEGKHTVYMMVKTAGLEKVFPSTWTGGSKVRIDVPKRAWPAIERQLIAQGFTEVEL